MESINEYLSVCERAIRIAGEVIQKNVGNFDVRQKGPSDLVTEVDFAAQQAVSQTIWDAFPDHRLIGEEDPHDRSKTGQAPQNSEYRWIIDPLDGTINYVHGVPHYSISLALERNGDVLVAGVLNPVSDECFMAAAGQGASLNGKPIHTSNVSSLSEALAAVGFPPGVQRDSLDLKVFLEILFRCQAIRRSGSAALNLCYIACGRYDLFWTFSTKIWDVAAGVLLIREAGGAICTPDGGEYVLGYGPFLTAANLSLLKELQNAAAEALKSK